ncbi:MAG TPA: hypothetical protein VHX40_08885 [Acidimicrobiales bacterium]|jgi:hypothetical protein|nr:hypothetical protein [Acidimicrobiales bacterium]
MDDVVTEATGTGPSETGPPETGTEPLPPPRRGPGLRPALLVVGIAVLLVLGFGLTAAFTGQSPPPAPSATPTRVAGTSLRATPATAVLKPIEQPGTPPSNILDTLTVPVGTTATAHTDNSASATGYDEQVDLSLAGASQASVVAFYRTELDTNGWKRISVGPATNEPTTTQVLAQAAGDDGWYWEAGALVSPTVFGPDGKQTTPFTIRLFQVPDED